MWEIGVLRQLKNCGDGYPKSGETRLSFTQTFGRHRRRLSPQNNTKAFPRAVEKLLTLSDLTTP
jgi:hypothetical protein